jgi:uncharacterized membrane protein
MRRKWTTRARNIAISLMVLSFVLMFYTESFAGLKAGTVTHLSGPLLAKKADGTTKALGINSIVELGDTIVTEKKTFARIKFTDNGEMVLRPDTQFRVSSYNFDQEAPKKDNAIFKLLKGGIRSITGLIGKRGDQNGYKLETPTAVAGVRGTTYECKICEGNCGSLPNGLYLFVVAGTIEVKNNAGTQNITAGQYAYVQSSTSAPKILPGNPGINFTLPPSSGESSKGGERKGQDGCIVR